MDVLCGTELFFVAQPEEVTDGNRNPFGCDGQIFPLSKEN